MKNDAKELVRTFVADKLDDDITRLACGLTILVDHSAHY